MKLYHGTSAKYLPSILEKGIQPTSQTGNDSNWEVTSANDRVYLSDTYPLYFAIHAAMELGTDAVLIEVEVDESLLLPDEDFLAQAAQPVNNTLIATTEKFRDELYDLFSPKLLQDLAMASLRSLGTACIKEVTPDMITGHAVIPREVLASMVLQHCDPTITIMNHRILANNYKESLLTEFTKYKKQG